MSQSGEQPIYTYPGHITNYDTVYVREPGAQLSMLMEEVDELMYPDAPESFLIGAHSAKTGQNYMHTNFLQEYIRADRFGWAWPLETITIGIEHTMYLGRSAIKQSYKVRIDSSIHKSWEENGTIRELKNRTTSIYYLEEIAGNDRPYLGSLIRPNILGEENPKPEAMTVYDCEELYDEISQLRTLAIYDHSDTLRSTQ